MKSVSQNEVRVLWAVDILSTDKKVRGSAEALLKTISKQTPLKIHPTYIVRFSEQAQPLTRGEGRKVFLKNVEDAMKRWLSGVKLNLEKPKAVLQEGVYLRSDVDALVSESKKTKADLILVNTHARKGFSRFWMGSFAETLMHHSAHPVLFLNPSSKLISNIKTILFPTNLSPDSKKTLQKTAELAKKLKADLVLYNNVEFFTASPGVALTETMIFTQNLEKDLKERKKTLEKWASHLKTQYGVKVKTIVDDSDVRVSDGITKAAKKLPSCVIAMDPQTGPVLSVLVGSTTRRVVREANVPVLVMR